VTLRNKLAISFLAIGVLFAVQVFITIQSNNKLSDLVEEAVDKNQMAVVELDSLTTELQKIRRYEKEYFIYIGDAIKKSHYEYEWSTALKTINDMLDKMQSNKTQLFSDADQKSFDRWQLAVSFYAKEFAKIVNHYSDIKKFGEKAAQATAMHSVQANSMIKTGKNKLSEVMKEVSSMSRARAEKSHLIIEDIEETFSMVKWLSIGFTLLAMLIAVVLVVKVPGGLLNGIRSITENAERLAQNDFSQKTRATGVSELDVLARQLERIRINALQKTKK
jgi:methyl-accepting chemotaxis protein